MTQVKIYVVDEEDKEYFSFSSITDAAIFLDMAVGTVNSAMKDGRRLKNRYSVSKVKPQDIEKHKPSVVQDTEQRAVQNRKYMTKLNQFWGKRDEALAKLRAMSPGKDRDNKIVAYNLWAKENFPDIEHDFISLFDL